MALSIGTQLGPYEIVAPIGAGGMGEVYRARDKALGRDVAIKILHPGTLGDPDRLRRFRQEAQAAACLNHPNILAIYHVGEHDGTSYIVSELLEGESLRERLRSGTLPVRRSTDFALQIADGLAAAHEKGIIHRDLKPENLFLTKDGRAKILDFGLAKLTQPEEIAGDADGLTQTLGSAPGMVLGTVGYMSPEQVRGKKLDSRSDIFSFGLILYEMLSGKNIFLRATAADTMSAILKEDPRELGLSASAVSPALDRVVRRCLEKDPADRFQSVRDLGFALQAITGSGANTTSSASEIPPLPAQRVRPSLRILAMVAASCLLLGAAATWLALRVGRSKQPDAMMVTQVSRLTHEPGLTEWPTWSPDGSLLAFASNRSGNFEIYVRRIEGGQEVNITNDPSQNIQPAISPDGNSIAFVSTRSSRTGLIKIASSIGFEYYTYGGDIWIAPTLGGPPRRLAQDGNCPIWSPDGKKIAYVSGFENHRSILEIPGEGGAPHPVLSTADSRWEIIKLQYSPQGRWLVFETKEERLLLMPASGGTPQEILRGSSAVWDPSGKHIYYATLEKLGGSGIQSVEFDESTGRIMAFPHSLGNMTGILRDLEMSRNGRQLVVSERQESLNLTRLPLAAGGSGPAGPEELLNRGDLRDRYPSFSPDGRRIAFGDNRLRDEEVWILDLATRHRERLRLPQADLGTTFPFWSPDGRQLAVTRLQPNGSASLWIAAVDGSTAEEVVAAKPALSGAPFSPDGRNLLYSYNKDGFFQLFILDLASRKEHQLTFSASDKYDPIWSPDGQLCVYSSNQGGNVLQIWRIATAGGEEQRLTNGYDRIRHLSFSPDGRWVYLQPNHLNIYRMPAGGGPRQPVTTFPEGGLFLEDPKLSPDGRWLAYCHNNGGSSLWLLELGNSPKPTR